MTISFDRGVRCPTESRCSDDASAGHIAGNGGNACDLISVQCYHRRRKTHGIRRIKRSLRGLRCERWSSMRARSPRGSRIRRWGGIVCLWGRCVRFSEHGRQRTPMHARRPRELRFPDREL